MTAISVHGVRKVVYREAGDIQFRPGERMVVVLNQRGYFVASRAHLPFFDVDRNVYRYDPKQGPVFPFNGLGAEQCPELVAALRRMGVARREHQPIQSGATSNDWLHEHPDVVSGRTKEALLSAAGDEATFRKMVTKAVVNALDPLDKGFVILNLEAIAQLRVIRDSIMRSGAAFFALDPTSPAVVEAARSFYGEARDVMPVENSHEYAMYFPESPCYDTPVVRVMMDGEGLDYAIPPQCRTYGDIEAMIGAGPIVLYDQSGPRTSDDIVPAPNIGDNGLYEAAVLIAVILPDNDVVMDRWQLFYGAVGGWIDPGPFTGGAICINVLGCGVFFTRRFPPGVTYAEVYDAVFGFGCLVQLYDPDPVDRGDAVRSNTLTALTVPSPDVIDRIRCAQHFDEAEMKFDAIFKQFRDLSDRQRAPTSGVVIDHAKLLDVAPACITNPGTYDHRKSVAGILASTGIADGAVFNKSFKSALFSRLASLTGTSDLDAERLRKMIDFIEWYVRKGIQSKATCMTNRFCTHSDKRECPLFRANATGTIADKLKISIGKTIKGQRYAACPLCNRVATNGPVPADRKFQPRRSLPPQKAIMKCPFCPYTMCASCYFENKRCFGCERRPVRYPTIPPERPPQQPKKERRAPRSFDISHTQATLACCLDGDVVTIGLEDLKAWIRSKREVTLSGFEQLFPVPAAPAFVTTTTFVDDYIPTRVWQTFAGASREELPSISEACS